uniref:Uncharacterized protein n=1 Tax=Oryza meridionalis TaxID=40149 RepID=A0A0E0C3B1_9ORYZ
MGRQRGGRRQRRATPAANEPPSKAMGHAAVTKADTGGARAGRRSQCGCGLEQDEDGGGRGGDSFGGDGGRRC